MVIMKYTITPVRSILWWDQHLNCPAQRKGGPYNIHDSGIVVFNSSRPCGPAHIFANGYIYYKDCTGRVHRTCGPALIHEDGRKEYWIHGVPLAKDEFFLKYGVV